MDSEMVRGKPLTKDETKALLSLIENSKIILSKTTNATSNKMKAEEWVRLTDNFNATAASVCRRTHQQLRLKWENLKKNSRKRSAKIRMNRIQTGGGTAEYIPPDEVLDRVASLLGSTGSGFMVPFGGDRELEVFVGSDCDHSGDGHPGDGAIINPLKSQGSIDIIPLTIENCNDTALSIPMSDNIDTSVTVSTDNSIVTSVAIPVSADYSTGASVAISNNNPTSCTITTPKNYTLNTIRTGNKKIKKSDNGRAARNFALAEYYVAKKKCVEANLSNILLHNENLSLANEKLKLELEKLKK